MSDPSFPAVLGTRQRWIAGLGGIGLGFVVPFILSVILVATSGDMALLVLPLPCLFALAHVSRIERSCVLSTATLHVTKMLNLFV